MIDIFLNNQKKFQKIELHLHFSINIPIAAPLMGSTARSRGLVEKFKGKRFKSKISLFLSKKHNGMGIGFYPHLQN